MEEFIPITMFMCIAAVAILRPISTKLGGLLEAMTRDRVAAAAPAQIADESELARIRVIMEHVSRRIDLIEERLDFTERLVGGSRRVAGHIHDTPLRREESLRP
jgi:hypothetical protein